MMPKRHIVFHAIPVTTIVAVVVIAVSGIDSGGDLPGLLRLLVVLLSAALWSLLFSVAMLVHVVRRRYWWFLALAIPLLAARVVYFSEIAWGNSEDHLYLWLPVEYILFYLVKHDDTKLTKLGSAVITAALYGLCCLACATTFRSL
ncbi:hypothetical protein ACFLSJ_07290 [Verrucomicrobiota bacterium]